MTSAEVGAATRTTLLIVLLAGAILFAVTRPEPLAYGQTVTVDGVPHVYYGDAGVQPNPVAVAGWALDGHLLEGADWLAATQEDDGSWRHGFDYMVTGRVQLDAGWASGMAQGRAMVVLVRAFEETRDRRYLDAATAAFGFLMVPVSEGGVRADLDGGLWFEEYPTTPASYVLNGALFTLEGLREARGVVPGAGEAYTAARATIETNLGRWDDRGRVAYDLLHESLGGPVHYDQAYDAIHERLLREELAEQPSPTIETWLERWYPATAGAR